MREGISEEHCSFPPSDSMLIGFGPFTSRIKFMGIAFGSLNDLTEFNTSATNEFTVVAFTSSMDLWNSERASCSSVCKNWTMLTH